MTETIHAPWTSEQVACLEQFQIVGNMHPFTCGADRHALPPRLVPSHSGWYCPDPNCDYTQDWAHAFMLDPSTWPRSPFGERHGPTPRESRPVATGATDLTITPTADAIAAELHRRWERLEELNNDPERTEATERRRMQVHGELMGLRGALGIVLGGTVPGGSADHLGMAYHLAWTKREGKA